MEKAEKLVDELIKAVEFYHANDSQDRTEVEKKKEEILQLVIRKQ